MKLGRFVLSSLSWGKGNEWFIQANDPLIKANDPRERIFISGRLFERWVSTMSTVFTLQTGRGEYSFL